jgi:hypothetical protein
MAIMDPSSRHRAGRKNFSEQEFSMSIFASPRFLRLVMWADAASCAATGALQLACSGRWPI